MTHPLSIVVLGATGLVGSAVCLRLRAAGHRVTEVISANYTASTGLKPDVLINCNGNSFRYRANQDPRWDFEASVVSVERSLFDFSATRYIYISTVDVYPNLCDPLSNRETTRIEPASLDTYGFHKWLAERLVEKFSGQYFILRLGTAIGPGLRKGPIFDLQRGPRLFMSLDSTLTLIDTRTVARFVDLLLDQPEGSAIFNVTGSGSAVLKDLAGYAPGPPVKLAPGAELKVHRYNVDNATFSSLLPVPSSLEIGRRFLQGEDSSYI